MSVFSKRNLLVGLAIVVVALGASVAIWGVPKFVKRPTSVKSQVSAYLLDDRGTVNGLLLASGDQLRFSPETGKVVASQIKIGDEVSVTGHAGEQSSYGRQIRVEQIAANGQTIVEVSSGPSRKHERNHGPKGRDHHERAAAPSEAAAPVSNADDKAANASPQTQENSGNAKQALDGAQVIAPVAPAAPETTKVTGTIRAHLVNGHGDVEGLIMSSGEQVRFSPKVGKLVVSAAQGSSTQISIEGTVVRNDRGSVIRPTYITVGNQTITVSLQK